MIWNGDADGQDICSLIGDMTATTAVTYPLQQKARAANKTLRAIWSWIFSAYGGWQFDDANNTTNLPIGTAKLTTSQADYDIPTGSLTIRGVEILQNSTTTVYTRLTEITEEELAQSMISEASFFTAPGVPLYYRPIGSSIKLYPAPSYDANNGLRVTFDRGSVSFASTDTTKQPGFASEFHEAVAVGAALEYARYNVLASVGELQRDMDNYQRAIKEYYSQKFKERFPSKVTALDLTSDYR